MSKQQGHITECDTCGRPQERCECCAKCQEYRARIAELEGLLRESEVKLLAETQATNLLKRIRTALRESE